eukprot:jgi/Astpho2/2138/Aster-03131
MLGLHCSRSWLKKSDSLQHIQSYRDSEASAGQLATRNGVLIEYETLELRCNPPQITIANDSKEDVTVVTMDSANRPGTLVEVVQHFTQLGLDVVRARISSDGGWFVDVFDITEATGAKVTDERKLQSIKQMLSIHLDGSDAPLCNADETDDWHSVATTVFELAGQDTAGLLADVTQLLTSNGCDVRSAAVWTFNDRVAFVLSVTENGQPVQDGMKLQRLRQLLLQMMDEQGTGIVSIKKVRGEVHHDRRLHQLMLQEGEKAWNSSRSLPSKPRSARVDIAGRTSISSVALSSPSDSAGSMHAADCSPLDLADPLAVYRSPKHSKPVVAITHCGDSGYWLVTITCKDRSKLLFDTVCTLADLDYDVYHATIDSNDGVAQQEYYVKPRLGRTELDQAKAAKLAAMLEASIQRRFPKGLKVHVHSVDRFGCLAALTRELKMAELTITRAKVKTYAINRSSGHTFYIMGAHGEP